MPRTRHTSNAGAPRARLLSTPHPEGTDMSTTIAGVKFSDQLAALLDHAQANGFRIEQASSKGRAADGAVVVYAPDKTITPITVTEVKARFNKAHYENVRRDLYRAGLPPLPGDTNPNAAAKTAGFEIPDVHADHIHDVPQLVARLRADRPDRAEVIAGIVGGVFTKSEGALARFDSLAASLIYAVVQAEADLTKAMQDIAIESAMELFGADVETEKARADAAVKRADAAEAKLAAADARADKARADCAAALRRAEAAEAKAAAAEAVLAPLRAYVGSAEAGA